MSKIRVIHIGCGNIGKGVLRYMKQRNMEIVAAIDNNPAILNKDIAGLIGLDEPTGIKVTDNLEAALEESKPTVAMITTSSFIRDIKEASIQCLSRGIHVITSAEEACYPWDCAPEDSKELDELAKAHNATIVGSGNNNMYNNALRGFASGINRIDTMTITDIHNLDNFGPHLAQSQGAGLTVEEFNAMFANAGEQMKDAPDLITPFLKSTVSTMGWTVKNESKSFEPCIAEEDVYSTALDTLIPKGRCIGMTTTITIETNEGPVAKIQIQTRTFGKGVNKPGYTSWSFKGDPDLKADVVELHASEHTSAGLVNRIEDVFVSPRGFILLSDMPK